MTEQQTVPTEAAPEPGKASRWEDYIDVFFSPAELFRRRARDGAGVPFLTLLALGLVFYFLLLPANTIIVRTSIPPDAQAQLSERALNFMTYAGAIMIPIVYAIMILTAAALLWVGGRVADLRTEFSRTLLIATYAAFVLLLSQILGGVLVLIQGEAGLDIVRHLSFGPLRFVGSADMDKVQMALLRRFDLFYIWQAVLWAVGLHVIYKAGYARAGAIAFVTWLLFAVPGIIGALLNFGAAPAGGG
jgi:hypothetical protein